MARVNGMTAESMQAIVNSQITQGAIDLSGDLIFTRRDGTTFNAGAARGERGLDAYLTAPGLPFPSGANWVRIGILDGVTNTGGAGIQFVLSGIGGMITRRRSVIHVNAIQRGTNTIDVRAWTDGLDDPSTNEILIYTRQLAPYRFELWVLVNGASADFAMHIYSRWKTEVTMDYFGAVAPDNIVLQTILSRIPATIADMQVLTPSDTKTVSPAMFKKGLELGSVMRGTSAERDAHFGVPKTDAQRVDLANGEPLWFNKTNGWLERYYATTGLPGLSKRGLVSGVASGWYPILDGPTARLAALGSQNHSPGSFFTNWRDFGSAGSNGDSYRNSVLISRPVGDLSALQTSLPGRYAMELEMYFPNGSGTGVFEFAFNDGNGKNTSRMIPIPLLASYGQYFNMKLNDIVLFNTGRCYARTTSASWAIGNDVSHMLMRYLGPALVSA